MQKHIKQFLLVLSLFSTFNTFLAAKIEDIFLTKTPHADIVTKFKLKHPEKLRFYRGRARVFADKYSYNVVLPVQEKYNCTEERYMMARFLAVVEQFERGISTQNFSCWNPGDKAE